VDIVDGGKIGTRMGNEIGDVHTANAAAPEDGYVDHVCVPLR
jgi:hypothetical protein